MENDRKSKIRKNGRTKAPAFQWYAMDWLTDVNLRICSRETRADWADLLNYMFLSDERGKLKIQGRPMTLKEIQNLLKLSDSEFDKTIRELLDNGVMRIDSDGVYYSSRMVKDEEIRKAHAEAGKLGGNPKLKKKDKGEVIQKVNLIDNQNQTPSSSSSSSNNNTIDKSIVFIPDPGLISDPSGPTEEFLCEEESGPVELLNFIEANCPTVQKMKIKMDLYKAQSILKNYSFENCREIFLQMENKPDLVKKYSSAHLTALNWLKRRNDSNPTTHHNPGNGFNPESKPGKPNFTSALRKF